MVRRAGRVLDDWRPEDRAFWQTTGRRVAGQNLLISTPALFLAFAVWTLWSAVVVKLNAIGFAFSEAQLFWLAALPALSGATLRIFYSFAVPIFGGRNWTALTTASLLLPAVGIGLAVQNPQTPYGVFALLALLCGLGGGNFASSTANINYFYPASRKGLALGLNAGIGNLGLSAAQAVVPIVIASSVFGALGGSPQLETAAAGTRPIWLQNAGFVWAPPIVLVALAAWFGMHNLTLTRGPSPDAGMVLRRGHNWLLCWLYLGSFGTYIGLTASFPRVIQTQFPLVDPLQYAFLGPLAGALTRPLGGWLADWLGGARITFGSFLLMALAAGGVIGVLQAPERPGAFTGFLVLSLVLFATSGVGGGASFQMIPAVLLSHHTWGAPGSEVAEASRRVAQRESSVVLGFASAIGAYGGFLIPLAFGYSIQQTGSPTLALAGFVAFYLACLAVTWWHFLRRGAATRGSH